MSWWYRRNEGWFCPTYGHRRKEENMSPLPVHSQYEECDQTVHTCIVITHTVGLSWTHGAIGPPK
jgi:hypothetical protein